ncbi:MAG: hypothetical protein IJW39_00320, partial [Opitutales bacterium]|nr:hypothetical protein [Opitutales bacterium]
GAGTLKLVASDKTGAFSLDSNVKHLAGTVAFENGGVVSGTYSVADQGVAVVTFSGQNASAFDGGLELGAKSFAWIQNNGSNTLKLNGVSSGESTYVRLSGSNITVSGETANFGSLTEVADDGNVLSVLDIMAENVTVDATTFSAGFVKFADGTTLAIDADTTATANALYVGENVSATLDLRDVNAAGNGAKFSVGTEQAVSVFGGTGTLNVLGGTLELNGVSYGNDAPTVVLNNATLAFAVSKVTDDEGKVVASVANLSNVQTAEGSSGTIAKTGAGTLVILDNNNATDLAFDGKISVSEGDLRMTETASKASVAVEAGATLGFLGAAELADESEARNVLANELSGKGTIAVWGTLYANDANSKFDGTLKAVGGTIYVSSETSDWLKNGAEGAARGIAVSSEYGRGTIATYDEAVTLSAVTLDGSGIFVGADNESALTVERVDATAAGSLTLRGYGTLGAVEFATTGSLTVDSGSEWTLNGEAEGLTSVSVSGTAVVANSKALGTAGVAVGGMLAFDAAGTYTNDLTLSAGAVVKATKDTVLTGTLARSWTGTSNVQFIADGFEVDGEVTGASLTLGESVLDLTGENIALNAVYADSTLAVDVEKTNAFLRATTKLSGAGTFEKKGEGSLKL